MEIPRKKNKDNLKVYLVDNVGFNSEYDAGFNECHDQYTKAMIERLKKCKMWDDNLSWAKKYVKTINELDQLIKELHRYLQPSHRRYKEIKYMREKVIDDIIEIMYKFKNKHDSAQAIYDYFHEPIISDCKCLCGHKWTAFFPNGYSKEKGKIECPSCGGLNDIN